MLESLEITQFALIEQAYLELESGFNCITGETGAGKSLLLGAISAITGKQVSKNLIRTGADKATVQAVFSNIRKEFADNEEVLSFLDEDEDEIILAREIKSNGRNTCRINGNMVSLTFLKSVGEALADIHGQNDRQQIFDKDKHLSILDKFADKSIYTKLQEYKKSYLALNEINRREKEILADPEERRMVLERLDYQINEIDEISPKVGEDDKLREKRSLLQNTEKIRRYLNSSIYLLEGDDEFDGAQNSMDTILSNISDLADINSDFKDLYSDLENTVDLITSIKSRMRDFLLNIDDDSNSLEAVSARLDKITRLTRKHNTDIAGVWNYYERVKNKRDELIAAEENIEKLLARKEQVSKILLERGLALREARKQAAVEMKTGIEAELSDLGMENAVFEVEFNEFSLEEAKSYGLENAEFMLAANLGEDLKPLSKTASGGEASRIMLAIKVILAQADDLQLLIFDEIDTGISGQTTAIVAEKLNKLAQSHQVVCVTHQAQIAASADKQFFIYKDNDAKRTWTHIKPLETDERVFEISRLLSGDRNDENSQALAKQLLNVK